MGLIAKTVEQKWSPHMKTYYLNKGYVFTKMFDKFTVKVEDLMNKSSAMVKVKCDYCGEEKEIRYSTYLTNEYLNTEHKYACLKCSGKMRETLPYEQIKKMVENLGEGYKLLSETYVYNNQNLKIQCNKGHIYETTYNSFKQGCKCTECDKERWMGINNPRYNESLTDEERLETRDTLENINWRNGTYKKDNYTCQYCGVKGGRLNAHHLDGFRWCEDERLDIDNGITLCKEHHKEFHHIYGYGHNTKEQFNKWILLKSAIA